MPTAHRELLAVAATSPAQRVPCLLESIRSQRGIGSSSLLLTSQLACGSCNRREKRSHHSLASRTEDCRELRKKRSSRTVLQLTQTSSWCSVMTSSYMKNLEYFSSCTLTKEFRKKHPSNTVLELTQTNFWCFGMTYDIKKPGFFMVHFDQRIPKVDYLIKYCHSIDIEKVLVLRNDLRMKNREFLIWYSSIKELQNNQLSNTVFQLTQTSSWCFGMTYDVKKLEFLLWFTLVKEFRKQILSDTVFLSMDIKKYLASG